MSIEQIKKQIRPILEQYEISRVAVFGSFARGEQTKHSDVDVLVQFKSHPKLAQYLGVKRSLEKKLGRRVDLVTESSLNRHVKPYVLKDLKVLYDEKA